MPADSNTFGSVPFPGMRTSFDSSFCKWGISSFRTSMTFTWWPSVNNSDARYAPTFPPPTIITFILHLLQSQERFEPLHRCRLHCQMSNVAFLEYRSWHRQEGSPITRQRHKLKFTRGNQLGYSPSNERVRNVNLHNIHLAGP